MCLQPQLPQPGATRQPPRRTRTPARQATALLFGQALAQANDPDLLARGQRVALKFADVVGQRCRDAVLHGNGGCQRRNGGTAVTTGVFARPGPSGVIVGSPGATDDEDAPMTLAAFTWMREALVEERRPSWVPAGSLPARPQAARPCRRWPSSTSPALLPSRLTPSRATPPELADEGHLRAAEHTVVYYFVDSTIDGDQWLRRKLPVD